MDTDPKIEARDQAYWLYALVGAVVVLLATLELTMGPGIALALFAFAELDLPALIFGVPLLVGWVTLTAIALVRSLRGDGSRPVAPGLAILTVLFVLCGANQLFETAPDLVLSRAAMLGAAFGYGGASLAAAFRWLFITRDGPPRWTSKR